MMYRSLAIVALTLASSGPAFAQSIYLYVAPGATVYVGTPTNDVYGAPPVGYVPGGSVYGAPGPIIGAP